MTWNGQYWDGTPDPLAIPPLLRFIDVTGLQPDYLWLGDSATDVVRAEVLTPQAGALVNQPTNKLHLDTSLSAGGSYKFAAASMDALDAGDPTVADFAYRMAAFYAFRTSTAPAIGAESLLGKRPGAPSPGYEFQLNTTGQLIAFGDVGASAGTVQLLSNLANGYWHVGAFAVEGDPDDPGLIRIASESDADITAVQPAGSLANLANLAIGQQRINAAESEVAMVALVSQFAFSPAATLHDACTKLADELFWTTDKSWL